MQSNGMIRIAIQKSGRLFEGRSHPAANGPPVRDLPGPALRPVPEHAGRRAVSPRRRHSRIRSGRRGRPGGRGEQRAGRAGVRVDRLLPLDFGFCSLSLAVPEQGVLTSLDDLRGKRIATSYPETLRRYSTQQGIEAEIVVLKGCVELAPVLQVADAICDLVSTGSTLRTHGLTVLDTVARSQAILIGRRSPTTEETALVERLFAGRGRTGGPEIQIHHVQRRRAGHRSNRSRSSCRAARVRRSCRLADPGYMAVHAMVLEETFWEWWKRSAPAGERTSSSRRSKNYSVSHAKL